MAGIPRLNIQYPDLGNVLARGAAIKGQEGRNVLTQMQIADYPEERNWLEEKRGYAREDRALAEEARGVAAEDRTRKRKTEDIDYENKVLEIGTSYLKQVQDLKDYEPYREYMFDKYDINPSVLPGIETFNGDEAAFDEFRNNAVLSAGERVALNNAELKEKRDIRAHKKTMKLLDVQLKKEGKGGKFGGLTANQLILKFDRDRKFGRISKNDKQKLIEKGVDLYNETFKDEMRGGLVENRPDEKKWLADYVSKVTGKKAPIAPANIPGQVDELLKSTTPQELMSRFDFLKDKVKAGELSVDDYNAILKDPKMQERFKSLKEPEKDVKAQLPPKQAKQLSQQIDEYTLKHGVIPSVPVMKTLAEDLQIADQFIADFFIGKPARVIIEWLKRQPKDPGPVKPIA